MSEHVIDLQSWSQFKSICITSKGLSCQYTDDGRIYDLYGPDINGILWRTNILKSDSPSDDQTDFETNFKSKFNGKILDEQLDSDGAPMSRVKVAPSGWSFQLRMVEFTTATVGSVVNNDSTGSPLGDATLYLYDGSNTLITDPANQGNCVKTVVDFEPPYDYYVVGGNIRMAAAPTQDVFAYIIGVPDVPANLGGSKQFVVNVNLKYVSGTEGLQADGRAAKWLQYNPTYHTNKLRFLFNHPAGYQLGIAFFLEFFKQ